MEVVHEEQDQLNEEEDDDEEEEIDTKECPVIETPNKKGELKTTKFVTTQVGEATLKAVVNKREESYKCTELESDEETRITNGVQQS